jgi:hypothetical protein
MKIAICIVKEIAVAIRALTENECQKINRSRPNSDH